LAVVVVSPSLDNGTVSLDQNRTEYARWWTLGPGVADALKRWHDLQGEPEPTDLVFVDEYGRPLSLDHMADLLRAQQLQAGLRRSDLTSRGTLKEPFGVHCFRRSFVTRSLALGQNEDWVRRRTGHKSEELLRYRQDARELAGGAARELDPLSLVLPELRGESQPESQITCEGGGTGRRASLRC
jgi:integrase